MATYWISAALGDDANDGLSATDLGGGVGPKASLKSTLTAVMALVPNEGHTINVINDDIHACTSFANVADMTANAIIGTNYGAGVGLIIQGTDVNGDPAMATVKSFSAATYYWLNVRKNSYIWIRGLIFDYSTVKTTATNAGRPINWAAETGAMRISDCELWFSTTVGAGTTITKQNVGPRMPYTADTSGTSVAGEKLEVYNCVYINAQLDGSNMAAREEDIHHNVFIRDADISPAVGYMAGRTVTGAAFNWYNNTFVQRQQGATVVAAYACISKAADAISLGNYYNNLFYLDCSPSATIIRMSGYVQSGYSGATPGVASTLYGHNLIATGPNIGDTTSWGTELVQGYGAYDMNSAFRAPGAPAWASGYPSYNGLQLEGTSQATDETAFTSVFTADSPTTYDWTPGDYTHVLPYDLRPLVGLTLSNTGSYVGAIAPAAPTAVNDAYTVTAGGFLTVPVLTGVLANDTDPGALTLTATLVANVGSGTLVLAADGSFTYDAAGVLPGVVTFTYTADNSIPLSSNIATVTITVGVPDPVPPDVTDPVSGEARQFIDSYPFYKPLYKATIETMLRIKRNKVSNHIDVRHYLQEHVHDESTSRITVLNASSVVTFTLGGVDKATGMLLATDQPLSVVVTQYNGTTNTDVTVPVTDMFVVDQCEVRGLEITNTSATTATIEVVTFD